MKEEQEQELEVKRLQNLVMYLMDSLELQTSNMVEAKPEDKDIILKWKNMRMHQLVVAQTFLSDNFMKEIDIFDLAKELSILKE
mgnify:CR=1 FL=1